MDDVAAGHVDRRLEQAAARRNWLTGGIVKRRYSGVALSIVGMGAVALTAADASARLKDPDPGSGQYNHTYNYPNYDPAYEVPPVQAAAVQSTLDDSWGELAKAGASALGGAGAAFGCMWLYRRHTLAG
ncbi:hypothetical protein [Kribbella endophytica]